MISFKKPRPVNKSVDAKLSHCLYQTKLCNSVCNIFLRKHDRTFNSFVDNQFITFSSLIFFDNETTEISFKTGCKGFPLGGQKWQPTSRLTTMGESY